jgi:hypothetical protein
MTIRFFDWTKRCYHILFQSEMFNRVLSNVFDFSAGVYPGESPWLHL